MLDILVYEILLLLSELFFKINIGLDVTIFATLLSFLRISLISCPSIFLKTKFRIIYESVIVILFNVYLLTQNYYYMFFNNLWSYYNLTQINELVGVRNEIMMKLSPILLVYLLFVVVWFVFVKLHKNTKEISLSLLAKILSCMIVVCLNFYMILANIVYFDNFNKTLSMQSDRDYLYQEMLNKPLFVQEFGVPEYIKRDIQKNLRTTNTKLSEEEKAQINDFISVTEPNEYTGLFEGKNLILIQAESLATNAIDPVLTPALYKMTQEGIYFDNYHAPLFPSNTNDTEFILQTGLMPSIEGATTSYKCENNYFPYSLANLFREKGYYANSYHSFFGEFYNRLQFHKTLGFEKYYEINDLFPEEEAKVDGVYWVDDIELFKASKELFVKEPYYSLIISASGHAPYEETREQLQEEYQIVKEYWGDKYNDELAYYQASQMKLDKAIGYLLDNLDDNTVVVVVADHYPYLLSYESQAEFVGEGTDRFKVPFIIYSKDIEPAVISEIRSSFDVYPTLSNLFNLGGIKTFGVDAFSDEKSTVYFVDGSIYTQDYLGMAADLSPYQIGQTILKTDYFRHSN